METKAPDGYVLTAQIINILDAKSYLDVTYGVDVTNISHMGRILIKKTDEKGNEICTAADRRLRYLKSAMHPGM